jgi:hypothetical protein
MFIEKSNKETAKLRQERNVPSFNELENVLVLEGDVELSKK